ncbi:MAG: TAXI family TRAP transporter solute-binding subunit [Peptococcaceae bacterium]|nr:TAXI family TRAP transporter solute-binding subunit [Peptococcaceae bacterium]
MKRKIIVTLLCLLSFVLAAGCGDSGAKNAGTGGEGAGTPEKKETVYLNIAAGPSTGVYYPLGTAMAQVWNSNIENLKATAQASNAGAHNINLMDSGDAQIGFVVEGVTSYAVEGINEFEGKPHPNLRGIAYIFSSVDQFVAAKNSGIESLRDLNGKKFVPGGMASGAEITAREILSFYDLDYINRQDVKAEFVNFDGAVERMKNEQADAALILTGVPNSAVMELISSAGAYLISLEPEMVEQITTEMPYYSPYTIKAGSYPSQEQEVATVCQENWILVDESMDEELVYQMTKALYEHQDDLAAIHAIAKNITLENTQKAMDYMPMPLHSGAERYYKEVGLIQ